MNNHNIKKNDIKEITTNKTQDSDVINLCEDDNDDFVKQYEKAVMASFVESHKMNYKNKKPKANDDNNNDNGRRRRIKRQRMANANVATAAVSKSGNVSSNKNNNMVEIMDSDDEEEECDNKKKLTLTIDTVQQVDKEGNVASAAAIDSHEALTMKYRQAVGPIRMEFIDSYDLGTKHAFSADKTFTRIDMNKLYKELLEYKLNLPIELSSSIFVRAKESQLHLVRAVITGPEATPYANGCFLFDIMVFDYPQQPPKVKFLTTGNGIVRFNPNLYNCGKVCLSLLGTWSGPGWKPKKSTLLQVLVSIQGLILVPEPYYNEPGNEKYRSNISSEQYNKNIRRYTLEYAIDAHIRDCLNQTKKPKFPEFHEIFKKHFSERSQEINSNLDKWADADKSLLSTANRIRKNLQKLVDQQKNEEKRTKEINLLQEDASPAASRPGEVIEMLDD